MARRYSAIAALPLALTACISPSTDAGRPSYTLADRNGRAVGSAQIEERRGAVRVDVIARGMAPGTYGMHVHMVGRCDAPDFTTAGAHWNPTGQQHGRDNPAGAHSGDLPNLSVGANGQGSVGFTIADASLTGGARPMADADGASLMIHAQADDYRTDPSGNSGARIACAVVAQPR